MILLHKYSSVMFSFALMQLILISTTTEARKISDTKLDLISYALKYQAEPYRGDGSERQKREKQSGRFFGKYLLKKWTKWNKKGLLGNKQIKLNFYNGGTRKNIHSVHLVHFVYILSWNLINWNLLEYSRKFWNFLEPSRIHISLLEALMIFLFFLESSRTF